MEQAQWTVNGRFLSQPVTGVQRYAEEIVRALDEVLSERQQQGANVSAELIHPPASRNLSGLKSIRCRQAGPGGGHLWEQTVLPLHVKGCLLSLCNTGPAAVKNQIICIHDLNTRLFLQSYSLPFRALYRGLMPVLGRRARKIVTVSDYSAAQLETFGIAPAAKISVIPNGHEHVDRWKPSSSPAVLRASGANTVVMIGSPAPHKNIALMLRLAGRLKEAGLRLAIAGAFNTKIFQGNPSLQDCTNNGDGIIWLGRISDGELAALLQSSLCLAFPSYEEGFGLPALEAMALGCPVAASDRASIPEVCGPGAVYASPDDEQNWLKNILTLRNNPAFREELIRKGKAQANKFSWSKSAEMYLDLLTKLSETGSTRRLQ
jgi:glycosyltransferase involved in cell wall biosynthesis